MIMKGIWLRTYSDGSDEAAAWVRITFASQSADVTWIARLFGVVNWSV